MAVRGLTLRKLLAGLACVGWLCASAPGLAAGQPGDAASTQAYLRASESYARRTYAEAAASATAIEARASEIARECPSALTYAPRDAEFAELTEATEMTVVYAGVAPVRSAALRVAHAIVHLRWSSGRLTRLVRSQAVEERSLARLALPDVCADIAAWRMSAYTALLPDATGFLARVQTIESGVGPSEESLEVVIMRLLRPYEGPAERRIVKRMEQLEARRNRRLRTAIAVARTKLAAALGVSAL